MSVFSVTHIYLNCTHIYLYGDFLSLFIFTTEHISFIAQNRHWWINCYFFIVKHVSVGLIKTCHLNNALHFTLKVDLYRPSLLLEYGVCKQEWRCFERTQEGLQWSKERKHPTLVFCPTKNIVSVLWWASQQKDVVPLGAKTEDAITRLDLLQFAS